MTKRIDINIVIVVIVLITLAFVFGCKDKVEADEPERKPFLKASDEFHDELVAEYERLKYDITGGELTLTLTVEIEPDEFGKLTFTAAEFDEIYKDEPALGKLAKSLYRYSADDDTITEHISETVHEPEHSVDMFDLLVKCIPTWPDYIELEKDLVVDISNRERHPANKMWTFGKGTKIYFKSQEK